MLTSVNLEILQIFAENPFEGFLDESVSFKRATDMFYDIFTGLIV